MADLVESPPAELMYKALKNRLLASHQLTDIQKVKLLVDMPTLGDRKPTQLQAAMIKACPRGQEDSVFMSALFLQKLPADAKILLVHMDHTCLKELATAGDQLEAMRTGLAAVAAVEADPGEMATVAAQGRHADAGGGEAEEEEAASGAGAVQGRETGCQSVAEALGVWHPGLQLLRRLLLAGKWAGQGQLNAVAPGRLLHVADQLTGTKFLVDTGASYFIFPHKSRRPPSGPKLRGPGGQDIASWGG